MNTQEQNKGIPTQRIVVENLIIALAYWGLSKANFMIFSHVGVLPMPIWPAAALAFVVAFYRGWRVAPGIAVGTVLANHFSLGAPWVFACCIAVMNTLGPVLAAVMIRRRISGKSWPTWSRRDVTVLFLASVIGSKWLLGLIPFSAVPQAFLRWDLAHALGTLLFAPPLLIWLAKEEQR